MKRFIAIFQKVNGIEVLKQYWRSHVLLFAILQTALQGFSKKALELVRLSVEHRLLNKLRKKYKKEIENFHQTTAPAPCSRGKTIWVCWLQGMEQAPALVQACYRALRNNIKDREIVLITQDNLYDYVSFPDYIQRKIDSGVISKTHMSDLLRLELLIKYGGTWIDSTVFCSGQDIPSYMLDSDLFFFQCLKPGADGHSVVMSNWFMTACTNHPVLLLTQKLLFAYWEKNDKLVDYFIFHYFFQLALEIYPEAWKGVVPFSSAVPHILLLRLFDAYDEVMWDAICKQTPFHKLSYKFSQEQMQLKDTYYQHVLSGQNQ